MVGFGRASCESGSGGFKSLEISPHFSPPLGNCSNLSNSFSAVVVRSSCAGRDHGVKEGAQDRHSKLDQEERFNPNGRALPEGSDQNSHYKGK